MADAGKLDLYREHKAEYVAPRKPVLLTVGPAQYLAISGRGAPGEEAFTSGVGALYAVAFTIKMTSKFAGRDYKVCHLEGLWWADDEGRDFASLPPEEWNWKLLIRTPDFIGRDELDKATQVLLAKGKPPQTAKVELESLQEGTCVQMLHVGPYCQEQRTIEAMSAFAAESGLTFHGRHHEIYLSDARRVAPERLRTILRHPVREG